MGSKIKDGVSKVSRVNSQDHVSYQDACVGTTVGTVTEPDCLGPCEPGTSVTLEGIVWHETENGELCYSIYYSIYSIMLSKLFILLKYN